MVPDTSELKIAFIEDGHIYEREDGVIYTSVSDVVKKLEKKKDWVKKCKESAKKAGISNWKDLWDKWEEKRTKGTAAGTTVHEALENKFNTQGFYEFEGSKLNVIPSESKKSKKWSRDIKQLENNSTYTEFMIYDHARKICGQVDEAVIRKNTINVIDTKTDKEIKRKGYNNGFQGEEKLLFPCDHLGACNYNIYSLKMSIYMYMLWKANPHLKVGKLYIRHITIERDEDNIPVLNEEGKPTVLNEKMIEVPYRRKEVEAILKSYV